MRHVPRSDDWLRCCDAPQLPCMVDKAEVGKPATHLTACPSPRTPYHPSDATPPLSRPSPSPLATCEQGCFPTSERLSARCRFSVAYSAGAEDGPLLGGDRLTLKDYQVTEQH